MHHCIKFILFWNDTLHVSDCLSVPHQELKTVHRATGICQTDTAVCLPAGRQHYLFDKTQTCEHKKVTFTGSLPHQVEMPFL